MSTKLRRFPIPTPPEKQVTSEIQDPAVKAALDKIIDHQHAQAISSKQRENLLLSQFLLEDEQIPQLEVGEISANDITSGTIRTGDLFLGEGLDEEEFRLDGQQKRITYKDRTGRKRVELGNLGADGAGFRVWGSSGTPFISVDGIEYVDGDKIGNNTVDGVKLANGAVNLNSPTVTGALNANQINSRAINTYHLNGAVVEARNMKANSIDLGSASVTGTLSAGHIDSDVNNVRVLVNNVSFRADSTSWKSLRIGISSSTMLSYDALILYGNTAGGNNDITGWTFLTFGIFSSFSSSTGGGILVITGNEGARLQYQIRYNFPDIQFKIINRDPPNIYFRVARILAITHPD